MKNRFLFCLFLLFAVALFTSESHAQKQAPGSANHQVWMKEIQQYKNEFIAKKLDLTKEQRARFLPLYNSMEKEIRKAEDETEQLYLQVKKKDSSATELEYEKAAEAVYEMKGRENAIEMKYFNEFKSVLTPRQLFKLKEAERDFTRQLMKHQRGTKK